MSNNLTIERSAKCLILIVTYETCIMLLLEKYAIIILCLGNQSLLLDLHDD